MIPWWVTYLYFVASLTLGILMAKKPKRTSEPQEPYGWQPRTTQREGIPYALCFGTAPVQGNAFGPWTEPVNLTNQDINLLFIALWGLQPPYDVTYSSKHQLNVRLAFGDGPFQGLQAGHSYLNGIPTANWTGVTAIERLGTDDQTATGLEQRVEIAMDKAVDVGTPVTVETSDSDYVNLAIIVGSLEGLRAIGQSSGNVIPQRLGCKIEIRQSGGAWNTLFDYVLLGSSMNPLRWLFKADGTYEGGTPFAIGSGVQHEWRVTCTYHNTVSVTSQGALRILGLQEIYDTGYRFPGMGFLELRAIATDAINGDIEFQGLLDGKICETVAGGAFAFSRCPAVVSKWLWTRPVIVGNGGTIPFSVDYYGGLDPSQLNSAEFAAAAAWFAALVPDGKGGTEPRFEFNGIFAEPKEAFDQAMQVAAMCRAVTWFDGSQVRIYLDKPTTPTRIFCDGNMLKGTYDEQVMDTRDIPSALEATIFNPDAEYAQQTVRVVDHLATTDRTKQIDGFGITKISQFTRLCNWIFDRLKNLNKTNTWSTGPCGMDAVRGEVAYVQSDKNGRAIGGHVTEVLAANTVRLDKEVAFTFGGSYQLIVETLDPAGRHVVAYDVASLDDTKTVVLTGALTYTPVRGDVFIYGEASKIDRYRITGTTPGPKGTCSFTGEQYKDEYYTRDNADPYYDTTAYVTVSKPRRSAFAPISRQDLLNGYDEYKIWDADTNDQPIVSGITFTGDSVGTVTWTVVGTEDLAWIRYNGTNYPIQADAVGTTDRYIYFDPGAVDPTTLKHTSDVQLLRGLNQFIGCENLMGVAYPRNWYRMAQEGTALLAPVSTTAFTELSGGQNGMTFHNAAAGGAIYLCLPAAIPGLEYEFRKDSANAIYVVPSAGEGFLGQAVDDYLELDAVGDLVKIASSETGTLRVIRLVGFVTYASGGGSVWLYDEAGHVLLDEAGLTIEVE